jgi:hypothetical protein
MTIMIDLYPNNFQLKYLLETIYLPYSNSLRPNLNF